MDGPRVAAGTAPARELFELTFRLDAGDYQAFVRKARWRAIERLMAMLPAFGVGALGAIAGCLVALAAGRIDEPIWFMGAVLLGGLIFYVLYRLALLPAYNGSVFSGQPLALGENKVVVDARGIAANMADIVIAMPWSAMRLVETDRHIFLMFARLAPIIVPKRAFVSSDEAKRFVAFARAMAAGARK